MNGTLERKEKMISSECIQQLLDTSAKLADAVEKHLSDIPSETAMTLALSELRIAQIAFDKDLGSILEALEKLDLTFDEESDNLKIRH